MESNAETRLPPNQLEEAIEAMASSHDDTAANARAEAARATIRDCDAKLARYRAALDADATVVGAWIAQTQAERTLAESGLRKAAGRTRMTADEIKHLVAALGDLRAVR